MAIQRNTVTVTMTILLFITLPMALVQALNRDLINEMCDKTSDPPVCRACIKGSPDLNIVEDEKEIIEKMMKCGRTDLWSLYHYTYEVIEMGSTNNKLRQRLIGCNKAFANVLSNGNMVRQQIAQGNVDEAKLLFSKGIFGLLNMCKSELDRSGVVIPSRVSSGISGVEADYKIGYQLIDFVTSRPS